MTAPRLLVVCVGNVCRSPMAERLLQQRLGAAYDVASAGVNALVGSPIDPDAAAELTRRGGSADGFAARRLTPAMADRADVVLTATLDIRSRVLEESPGAMRRTFTLVELADLLGERPLTVPLADAVREAAQRRSEVAHHDLDVPDPYRRGAEAHARAAEAVDDAVRRLVVALAPASSA